LSNLAESLPAAMPFATGESPHTERVRLNSVSTIVDKFAHGSQTMAQEFRPGQIVPQSGIYTVTHDPAHADTPHEVTVIKGRRFPTWRHCKGISFELAHAAKHVGEIDHLEEAHAPAQ
jgi:hypothetical protein